MERVSSGTILLGFIAILCGLLGVYSLRTAFRPKSEVVSTPVRPSVVPMASRDLTAGHQVTLGDVALVRMSRSQMKAKGVTGVFMSDADQIIGRTLKNGMERGTTFDTQNFYPDGVGPGIADRLKQGERAVTVSIVGADALIGFAGAGQIVDVLFKVGDASVGSSSGTMGVNGNHYNSHDYVRRWSPKGSSSSSYGGHRQGASATSQFHGQAITLMQGVRVLAIENNAVKTNAHKPVAKYDPTAVTLAVTPTQAEVLRVVQGNGEISLSLRNPNDTTTFQTIDARTLEDVLGIRKELGPRGMEVYRGQTVERLFFERKGELETRYAQEKPEDETVNTSAHAHELGPDSKSAF